MMDDATFEAIADRMVMRRLATDRAYRNAEDAEAQARREQEITEQVVAELERRAAAATPVERCEAFALCENAATTTIAHPILGDVPACDRCAAKLEALR